MNFFHHREKAKQRTFLLVVLLLLAIACLIAISVFAVSLFLFVFQQTSTGPTPVFDIKALSLSPIQLWVAALIGLAIFIGSFFKWKQIQQGGKVVAETLGGKLISPDSNKATERKILNVVEEMAIASGNPVPPVYLLDDTSINAFAAGHCRQDAVIGVTKGCISLLNRDELQGVIAHEFSHIHNGDMRLNMRLIAILHGIQIIGLIGYELTRSRRISKRKNISKGAVLGVLFIAIGYCGTFLGNIIKAAVSRQREFLADASAVQFTRNPKGISGALKKIRCLKQGSLLKSGTASEFSHMYFSQGIKTTLNALQATHPTIIERLRRISPYELQELKHKPETLNTERSQQTTEFFQQATNFIGQPQPHHHEAANLLLSRLPEKLRSLAHNSFSARAIIYGLLLSENSDTRSQQLTTLKTNCHPASFKELQTNLNKIIATPKDLRLTLTEMCLPAINLMSKQQFLVFKSNLIALIQADKKISLFEWCLYRIVIQNVEKPATMEAHKLNELTDEISIVFSLVVYAGKSPSPGGAFKAGIDTLGINKVRYTLSDESFYLGKVDPALDRLAKLKNLQKPRFIKAIAAIVASDGAVTIEEAECYRAICSILDCPVPPIAV